MTRPLRFGLHAITGDPAADARRAEDLGFGVLTVADHVIAGLRDPFGALAMAAAATSTIRLGTLVLNNDLRNPTLVARAALTLDEMCGGRLELGLGAGHAFPEYEKVGIPFDPPATRVARLRASIELLDVLLCGDDALPKPVQSPRMPLLVGGHARSVLRLAAERCDIVGLSGTGKTLEDGETHEATGFPPAVVDERMAIVESSGRDVERNVLVQWVTITDDPVGAAESLVQRAPYLTVDDVLGSPYVWMGSVESICDDVRSYRERWGTTYFTIFDRDADAAAPIVAALAP